MYVYVARLLIESPILADNSQSVTAADWEFALAGGLESTWGDNTAKLTNLSIFSRARGRMYLTAVSSDEFVENYPRQCNVCLRLLIESPILADNSQSVTAADWEFALAGGN